MGSRGGVRVVAALGSAVFVVAGLTACDVPGAAQAEQAADAFGAVEGTDPAGECQLLADQTRQKVEKDAKAPCAKALDGEDLPKPSTARSVDVYGHDARAVLAGDVIFLARFPQGWLVTAAGCTTQPDDRPYDCQISGG